MPNKICKSCKTANGVRSKACKECGESFVPKPTGTASIASTTKTQEEAKLSLDNPKFYDMLMRSVSANFNWGEADDDLIASIVAQRGLEKEDVEKACKMTIIQLWRKKWSL